MTNNENTRKDALKEAVQGGPQDGVAKAEKRRRVTVETPDATLIEHISDLRSMLIKSAVAFVFFFMLIFLTIQYWFPYLTKGHELIVRGPFEVIRFYIRTSGALGIGLSLPFICYFVWQFMRPGLVEKGRPIPEVLFSDHVPAVPCGTFLRYFVVHPISYFFLIQMGEENFDVLVTADEYMSFLLMTTMPFGRSSSADRRPLSCTTSSCSTRR